MPRTGLERVVAVLMLGICAALIILAVKEARKDEPQARPAVTRPGPVVQPVPAPATTTAEVKIRVVAPAKSKTRPLLVRTELVLTATGGDSWLAARAGSPQGSVVYLGTLPRGRSVTLNGPLWLRFGAASNLAAKLNGRALPLAPGTYSVLVSRKGLQRVPF